MLVRAHSSIHLADTKLVLNLSGCTEVIRERMNMLVLVWRRRLYFYKKSYDNFISWAAAPVATTTLGLGICTFPRPNEVVDWYSGTGVFRDTNRARFIWEMYPDLTSPRVLYTNGEGYPGKLVWIRVSSLSGYP